MKGQVMFWFRVRYEDDQVLHEATFKLFGQQCKVCNDSESSYEVIKLHHSTFHLIYCYFIDKLHFDTLY